MYKLNLSALIAYLILIYLVVQQFDLSHRARIRLYKSERGMIRTSRSLLHPKRPIIEETNTDDYDLGEEFSAISYESEDSDEQS